MQGSQYTDEQRRQAVVAYSFLGTDTATAESLGIPRSTLTEWKSTQWWQDYSSQIRQDVTDEISAHTLQITRKALSAVEDRLENGDTRYTRTGQLVTVPVSARDAALVFAITFDKRQLLLNRATQITESRNVGELAGAMLGAFKQAQERSAKTIEGEVVRETISATQDSSKP